MYINEVIREADALNPNEYTLNEKYAWIDELNATLMQEHMYKYARAELEPMEDGTYLLPEGITFEMVDRIIAQGRSIEKYDFRSFGITPLYTPRERFFVPVHCQAKGTITVIYLAQYEPIRTFYLENAEYAEAYGSEIYFVLWLDVCNLQTGDIITLTEGDKSAKIAVKSVEYETCSTAPSLSRDDKFVVLLQVPTDAQDIDDFPTFISPNVERIVTEQTLVPAPYDRMYIDWIIAKIAFYQNNYIVYNQQMNKFYNTLRQFDNWRISRAPVDKDNKIRNWMK